MVTMVSHNPCPGRLLWRSWGWIYEDLHPVDGQLICRKVIFWGVFLRRAYFWAPGLASLRFSKSRRGSISVSGQSINLYVHLSACAIDDKQDGKFPIINIYIYIYSWQHFLRLLQVGLVIPSSCSYRKVLMFPNDTWLDWNHQPSNVHPQKGKCWESILQ